MSKEQEQPKQDVINFNELNFARLGHNYFQQTRDGDYGVNDLNYLNGYINYILEPKNRDFKKYKVGIMLIAINHPYWQYMQPVVEGIRGFFLPGHDVEIMCWSDMPNYPESKDINYGTTMFATDSVQWPYPTLMRYHLMLQQEEYLEKFDYIFFLDLDMRVVNVVGDEILGDGLTAAEHPMYSIRREFVPPYEPNPESSAFIQRPGKVLMENGKPRFQPYYYAGGFQGGRTPDFIKAMKAMKKTIDDDMVKNYIAIWNDESHWNKYLSENTPAIVLSPSYVYPDSMINEYYVKAWGKNYAPKIVTLTKPFTVSKEGGAAAQQMMQSL